MNDRARLIDLLMQGELEADKQGVFNCSRSEWKAEIMADFLLENGVIILPCKIGDYCKIAKQIAEDNAGEGDIKIRYSVIETAQLIKIACVTANENGTQIMDISNVFAVKERE